MTTAGTPTVISPEIRACKNTSGVTIPKGTLVSLKASPTVPREVEAASAVTTIPYGVATYLAVTGRMFDVQTRGQALVLSGAAIAIGANVTSDAAGAAVTAGTGDRVWGVAVTEASAGAELIEVELAGPCGGSPYGYAQPVVYKGTIATAAGFPTAAAVDEGWMYHVTADVIDNDATKTNTGKVCPAGSEIIWNGASWDIQGSESTVQEKHAAGAFTIPAGNSATFVDTATAAAGTSCTLPAGAAINFGDIVVVGDYTGSAAANPITVGRTGGDKIDNVAADYVVNKAYLVVAFQSMGTGGWKTLWAHTPVASAATPQAVGAATAGTSKVLSPDDHVHAHGNQLGGTLHAAAVAGVSDGFFTAANATTLAAVTDDHIRATVTGLDMKTDEHEHSGVLNGDPAKLFLATHLLIKSSLNVGALNQNGTINIGTAADGAQLVAAAVLTGVGAVGTGRMIPIAAHAVPVAGNATLYVNVESAETGAGTLEIDVAVVGRQF